jgi:hypothetical protein
MPRGGWSLKPESIRAPDAPNPLKHRPEQPPRDGHLGHTQEAGHVGNAEGRAGFTRSVEVRLCSATAGLPELLMMVHLFALIHLRLSRPENYAQ